MDIIKITFIGMAGVMCAIFLKQWKSEFSLYIAITTAIVIFFFISSKIKIVAEAFSTFNTYLNTKGEYIKLILKMTGITYIAEFAAGICRDCGYGAVATQVEIFARVALLSISLPVIITLLETICGL